MEKSILNKKKTKNSRLQGSPLAQGDPRGRLAVARLGRVRRLHRAPHPRDALSHPQAHLLLAHQVSAATRARTKARKKKKTTNIHQTRGREKRIKLACGGRRCTFVLPCVYLCKTKSKYCTKKKKKRRRV